MGNIGEQIVTVLTAIVGLAIVAVLVSRNAQTSGVISAAGAAFTSALGTAVSPVTGFTGGAGGNITSPSLPSFNNFGFSPNFMSGMQY